MVYGDSILERMCFFNDQNFQRPLSRMFVDLLRDHTAVVRHCGSFAWTCHTWASSSSGNFSLFFYSFLVLSSLGMFYKTCLSFNESLFRLGMFIQMDPLKGLWKPRVRIVNYLQWIVSFYNYWGRKTSDHRRNVGHVLCVAWQTKHLKAFGCCLGIKLNNWAFLRRLLVLNAFILLLLVYFFKPWIQGTLPLAKGAERTRIQPLQRFG